jgi:hypothetical protein
MRFSKNGCRKGSRGNGFSDTHRPIQINKIFECVSNSEKVNISQNVNHDCASKSSSELSGNGFSPPSVDHGLRPILICYINPDSVTPNHRRWRFYLRLSRALNHCFLSGRIESRVFSKPEPPTDKIFEGGINFSNRRSVESFLGTRCCSANIFVDPMTNENFSWSVKEASKNILFVS